MTYKNELIGVKIVSNGDSQMTKDIEVFAGDTKIEGITSIFIDMKPEVATVANISVLVSELDLNALAITNPVCARCNQTIDIDSELARNERVIEILRDEIKKLRSEKE